MRIATIILCLALAGCATTEPQIRVQTIEVKVPVPCEPERPAPPAWVMDSLPIKADIDQQTAALLADRKRAKAYIGSLEAALGTCRAR